MSTEGTSFAAVNEVTIWLTGTVGLTQYVYLFKENGFDSLDLVQEITSKAVLVEMGIAIFAHQLKIVNAIQRLEHAQGNGQLPAMYNPSAPPDEQETRTSLDQRQSESKEERTSFVHDAFTEPSSQNSSEENEEAQESESQDECLCCSNRTASYVTLAVLTVLTLVFWVRCTCSI